MKRLSVLSPVLSVVKSVVLITASISLSASGQDWSVDREGDALDPAIQPIYRPYEWADEPPTGISFERSTDIERIRFTGRYANYTGADTWYPTWASDGNLYSSWTDEIQLDR